MGKPACSLTAPGVRAAAVFLTLLAAGCVPKSPFDRAFVSDTLAQRSGHGLPAASLTASTLLPEGVVLDDGLTEDEAVATALWNNAPFHTDLARLGFARADLVAAGMIKNPVLSLLFPVGPKQLEATLSMPIDVLWQRPRRVAAAQADLERIANDLVEHGLNLVRDARVAHVELWLSRERAKLAESDAVYERRVAQITAARLRAGDIATWEVGVVLADAALAGDTARRATRDAEIAELRLRDLLGIDSSVRDLRVEPPPAASGALATEALIREALAARPDLRAAEVAVEGAAERAGLERRKALAVSAMLDHNHEGREGPETGPGVLLEIPIFDWNRAGRARASAEMEQAAANYVATRRRVEREVREAVASLAAAKDRADYYRDEITPSVETETARIEAARSAGDLSELDVLIHKRRLVLVRTSEIELTAELARAVAQMERSVGRRL